MKSRPRILIIHTGGTFGMLRSRAGFASDVHSGLPDLSRLARFRTVTPFSLDSSSLTPDHWLALARVLARAMPKWDGFVVTHGTDTMAYTACALSFLLENLRKPVVLTGAQRPLSEVRSDARSNFMDALEVSTKGPPEVAIVFGGLVLRGNCARKRSLVDYRAFESPNAPALGEIGTDLHLHPEQFRRPRGRFRLRDTIDPRVVHLKLAPGTPASALRGLLSAEIRGVVLEAFGAGNIPLLDGSMPELLREVTERGITVVIVSGSEHGAVDLRLYEGGRAALAAGAISGGSLTAEAAVVKLMVASGRAQLRSEVEALFTQDWAGESASYA